MLHGLLGALEMVKELLMCVFVHCSSWSAYAADGGKGHFEFRRCRCACETLEMEVSVFRIKAAYVHLRSLCG